MGNLSSTKMPRCGPTPFALHRCIVAYYLLQIGNDIEDPDAPPPPVPREVIKGTTTSKKRDEKPAPAVAAVTDSQPRGASGGERRGNRRGGSEGGSFSLLRGVDILKHLISLLHPLASF